MSARESVIELWTAHPPHEFLYVHDNRQFLLDGQTIPMADLLPLYDHTTKSTRIPAEIIDEVPLVVDAIGRPSHLTLMHEWLTADHREAELTATASVMREVMSELDGVDYTEEVFGGGDHMSFRVGMIREGHPLLHVHGNCACLGVDFYHPPFRERAWREGFATYDFHNSDRSAEMIALYAGLGHLASLALH